ncbi:uncharacterized protein LOC141900520 [Tubulanus polymorphus]|uniref:uncharacterized protein LOC141900520 n=1 Tax=Tubulanus polymorphus TaxID=672921 RepID=UPI003DA29389
MFREVVIFLFLGGFLLHSSNAQNTSNKQVKKWCCAKTPKPVEEKVTLTYAHKVMKLVVIYNIKEYERCPGRLLKKCPVLQEVHQYVPRYEVRRKTEVLKSAGVCADEDLICCEGYEMYKGECYEPSALENAKVLESLGLLGI